MINPTLLDVIILWMKNGGRGTKPAYKFGDQSFIGNRAQNYFQ